MTTQPTNHRDGAAALFARAIAALDAHSDAGVLSEPAELAAVGILAALLAIDDDLDAEEQHQSEKFETTPQLADDDDPTVEQPRYGYGLPESEADADEVVFREHRWLGGRAGITEHQGTHSPRCNPECDGDTHMLLADDQPEQEPA